MGDWKSLPQELSFCVERWQEHQGVQVKVLLKLESRVTKTSFAKLSPFKPSSWSLQSAQHLHIQEASERGPDWWLCPSLADSWLVQHYIHSQSNFIEMIDAFTSFLKARMTLLGRLPSRLSMVFVSVRIIFSLLPTWWDLDSLWTIKPSRCVFERVSRLRWRLPKYGQDHSMGRRSQSE